MVVDGTLLQAAGISSPYLFLPVRRRRTMSLSLGLFGFAVRPSGLLYGLTGCRPPEVLFATAVRVVDRVHHDTADGGTLALPAHPAGLAPVDVRLLGVADLADGGAAARRRDGSHPTAYAGRRRCLPLPSSWMLTPALRAILAPPPGAARPRGSRYRPGCCAAAGCCRA